jgi:hypothetical protein
MDENSSRLCGRMEHRGAKEGSGIDQQLLDQVVQDKEGKSALCECNELGWLESWTCNHTVFHQVYGSFTHVDFDNEDVFAYIREYEGKKALVALNFRTEAKVLKLPSDLDVSKASYVIGNMGDNKPTAGQIKLQPLESAVFML